MAIFNMLRPDYSATQTFLSLSYSLGVKLPTVSHMESGSSIICNPPVTNTDRDVFVLLDADHSMMKYGKLHSIVDLLIDDGWSISGSMQNGHPSDPKFLSAKKNDANIIFLNSAETYTKICAATLLATKLNLTEKQDRISLFNALVNGHALPNWNKFV